VADCPLGARVLALDQLAHRLLDDVVHDVGGRVINPARLLDLGLLLDFGPVARRQPNYLPQELFVHLAQDVGRKNGELVRAVGVVQVLEYVL